MSEQTITVPGRFALTKEFTFEAAHQLAGHDGKCARLHGHSFRLKVHLVGAQLRRSGPQRAMLMDYSHISAIVKPFVDEFLDHQFLNETLHCQNPTSEFLAQFIFEQLEPRFAEAPDRVALFGVEVCETCTSGCLYQPPQDISELRGAVVNALLVDLRDNGLSRQAILDLIGGKADGDN